VRSRHLLLPLPSRLPRTLRQDVGEILLEPKTGLTDPHQSAQGVMVYCVDAMSGYRIASPTKYPGSTELTGILNAANRQRIVPERLDSVLRSGRTSPTACSTSGRTELQLRSR